MDYCGAFLHQFFEAFSKYCRLYTQDLTQSWGIRGKMRQHRILTLLYPQNRKKRFLFIVSGLVL